MMGYLVAIGEIANGHSLILGFFTGLVAIYFIIQMMASEKKDTCESNWVNRSYPFKSF